MEPILQLKNIKKVYPGVIALDNVSMDFYGGKVHAICGENGAGKSTFIKSITGAVEPTEGEIYFDGNLIENNSPAYSTDLGISAIYQEFNLVPSLTVAENIFLGNYPEKHGFVDFKEMKKQSVEILDYLGISISPTEKVDNLSVAYQQIVEIAKALVKDTKVLIMDEPSAALSDNEIEALFKIVNQLKDDGVAIIYISHHLEEVFELCDEISVLRDGEYVTTMNVEDTNEKELITIMVDRELGEQFPDLPIPQEETILEVKNLKNEYLKDISFSLRKGEILGIAGLVGAGRTELMRAIFGADPIETGKIYLNDKEINNNSPDNAISNGIGLLPEDRKLQGAVLQMKIRENITYANLNKISKFNTFIDLNLEREMATDSIRNLKIKTPSMEQQVVNLSGGNQQKVILAKWLVTDSDILIFDEPTRGIDVGAKKEIYNIMTELAKQGKSIIVVSSDMPEIIGISNRILVMKQGRINGELRNKEEMTQENILTLAS